MTYAAVEKIFETMVKSKWKGVSGEIYASEMSEKHVRPLCREAANGFEGAFETLQIKPPALPVVFDCRCSKDYQ